MYPKIKFMPKNWFDPCNFYSKVIVWTFCLRKYFLLFFAEYKLLRFHNSIMKISQKKKKKNEQGELVEKICLEAICPTDFCTICIHFTMGEKKYDF